MQDALELQATESLIRQVEEIEVTANIDGTDIDFIAELTTIPEGRIDGDYKVNVKLRKSHASADGFDQTCIDALVTAVCRAFEKGEKNLKEYWAKNGGQQGSLDFGKAKGKAKSDLPSSSN